MMIKKIALILSMVFVMAIISASVLSLSSSDITNIKVEANDVELSSSSPKSLQKEDEIEVIVVFDSNINTSNFQVEAVLRGADLKNPIEDISEVFDVVQGNRYDTKLNLKLPTKLEQGRYDLKIRFDDRTGSSFETIYPLDIGVERHSIEIKDILTSPEGEVSAGRSLLVSARVKNRGESKEEDIKITASIQQLGVSASDFIDELDEEGGDDDSATSEELFIRIPNNAKTGDYTLKVVVEFDDGDESVTKSINLRVIGEDREEEDEVEIEDEEDVIPVKAESKTIITVGPESQDITQGGSVVYPLTITNLGAVSKSYTVDVDGASWADFRVSPSNVIVISDDSSESLVISVSPKESAPVGEQTFAVTVRSGERVLKQVLLKANIKGRETTSSSWDNVKRSLEIGLVVLVVLLVIVALFIGFSKLRGNDEKPKEEQGYY
ncbi:MAG: hypothetical protein AABY14_02140 [Nanoarchaeota archaeon]